MDLPAIVRSQRHGQRRRQGMHEEMHAVIGQKLKMPLVLMSVITVI